MIRIYTYRYMQVIIYTYIYTYIYIIILTRADDIVNFAYGPHQASALR